MLYVAVDIGCIECGEYSFVLGVFTRAEDAHAICKEWKDLGWRGGQHSYEVFEVPEIDLAKHPPD